MRSCSISPGRRPRDSTSSSRHRLPLPETIGTRDAYAVMLPCRSARSTRARASRARTCDSVPGCTTATPTSAAGCARSRRSMPPWRYAAWVTGVRRADAATRADAQLIEWDAKRSMLQDQPDRRLVPRRSGPLRRRERRLLEPVAAVGLPPSARRAPALSVKARTPRPAGGRARTRSNAGCTYDRADARLRPDYPLTLDARPPGPVVGGGGGRAPRLAPRRRWRRRARPPAATEALRAFAATGEVEWAQRTFAPGDLTLPVRAWLAYGNGRANGGSNGRGCGCSRGYLVHPRGRRVGVGRPGAGRRRRPRGRRRHPGRRHRGRGPSAQNGAARCDPRRSGPESCPAAGSAVTTLDRSRPGGSPVGEGPAPRI